MLSSRPDKALAYRVAIRVGVASREARCLHLQPILRLRFSDSRQRSAGIGKVLSSMSAHVVRRCRALQILLLSALSLVLIACGGSASHSSTTTVNASVRPGSYCLYVQTRRALAIHPPKIGMELRNVDVDNFSGSTSDVCNERQLVYWGAPAPLGGERLAIQVRLFFAANPAASLVTAPGTSRGTTVGTTRLFLSAQRGRSSAQFVTKRAVVSVIVGCVSSSSDLRPTPCVNPPLSPATLQTKLLHAVETLLPQLRSSLG